ncbi:hypothetical protein E2C01_001672 [Portunus trituberculatus]|uniref:Uncharacterized protein n=1 Tax=Portunus trituberculatus TaxID=210409 RepID=A0A5B7CI75_PORTR|nr:hypothetical protein [Portunus trituberculatus]
MSLVASVKERNKTSVRKSCGLRRPGSEGRLSKPQYGVEEERSEHCMGHHNNPLPFPHTGISSGLTGLLACWIRGRVRLSCSEMHVRIKFLLLILTSK